MGRDPCSWGTSKRSQLHLLVLGQSLHRILLRRQDHSIVGRQQGTSLVLSFYGIGRVLENPRWNERIHFHTRLSSTSTSSLSLSYSRRIRSSQVPETSTSTSGRPTQDRCSTRSRLITTASAVFCSLMMAVSSSPVPWTVWCMSSSPMNWLDRRRLWDVKSSCCLRTVLIQDKEIPMYLIAEL